MWLFRVMLIVCAAIFGGSALAQSPPDQIMVNGKIVTANSSFSIHQALAITGERILAVGTNAAILATANARTRVIDLRGKTVIPGLIDNHFHFIRGAARWEQELRLDGVDSRQQALRMIANKATALNPGAWIIVLGGWSENQFKDRKGGFSPAELDKAAPDNPVFIQQSYRTAYVNTAALNAAGVTKGTRIPAGKRGRKRRGMRGPSRGEHPAGIPLFGRGAIRLFSRQLDPVPAGDMEARIKRFATALNRAGLTTVYGVGRTREGSMAPVASLATKRELSLRVFHTFRNDARHPDMAMMAIERIKSSKPFRAGDHYGVVGLGEHLYNPMTDGVMRRRPIARHHFAIWGRIAKAAAAKGWHVHEHAMRDETISSMLDEMERINKIHPLKELRWTIAHADTIHPETIARAKRLGANLAIHNKSMLQAHSAIGRFGDAALQFTPMRTIQDSGILWGLGSDSTIVAPYQPFITLWWAVTGLALDGTKVTAQTVSREEALIAHTRSNAEILFKEKAIGSLEPGKFADLLVLDRDYMTVPAEDIRHIRPVVTMVGGRVVHGITR